MSGQWHQFRGEPTWWLQIASFRHFSTFNQSTWRQITQPANHSSKGQKWLCTRLVYTCTNELSTWFYFQGSQGPYQWWTSTCPVPSHQDYSTLGKLEHVLLSDNSPLLSFFCLKILYLICAAVHVTRIMCIYIFPYKCIRKFAQIFHIIYHSLIDWFSSPPTPMLAYIFWKYIYCFLLSQLTVSLYN